MYCYYCWANNPDDYRFCYECGSEKGKHLPTDPTPPAYLKIALPTLLKVGGFPEDKVDLLMETIDYIKIEEILKLATQAWFVIAGKYFTDLNLLRWENNKEIKKGLRQPNTFNRVEVEKKLIQELAKKLGISEDKDKIDSLVFKVYKFENPDYILTATDFDSL